MHFLPQLYHYPNGFSSVTQIGLEVTEIPYELVLVDLSVGAHRKDPYLTAPAHVFAGGADRCAEQACVCPVSTARLGRPEDRGAPELHQRLELRPLRHL